MSTMMAVFTKSNTIRYLISKINIVSPVFYMVCVELSACLPTFLAGVVISFKYLLSPIFVTPSKARVFASHSDPFIMAFTRAKNSTAIINVRLAYIISITAIQAISFFAGLAIFQHAFTRAKISNTSINKALYCIKLLTAIQAISFFAGLAIFPHAFIGAALLMFFAIRSSQKQFSTNNTRLFNFISYAFPVTLSGTVLVLAPMQVRAGNIKLDPAHLAALPYTLLLAFYFAIEAAVFSTAFVNKRLSNVKLLTTMLTNTVALQFRKAMFYIAVFGTILTCTCLRSIYAVNFPAVQAYLFNHVISNIYAPLRLGALAEGASVSSSPGHKYSPRKQQLPQQINHTIKLQVLKAS